MFLHVKHLLNRSFIYTMILLVCLSCPVKRELKRVFNIPVSSIELTDKPNKTQLCQFTTHQSAKKTHYQVVKRFQSSALHNFSPATVASGEPLTITSPHSWKIPIYIQNEQFLI